MHGSATFTNADDLYGFISAIIGNITAYNVTVINNQIEQKGFLYTQIGSITIDGGSFQDNTGTLLLAPMIHISSAAFIGNQNTLGGGSVIRQTFEDGGAAYIFNIIYIYIVIEDSKFINNSVEYEFTFKCRARISENVVIGSNIECKNLYGGALYVEYGDVIINNCVMSNNRAPSGGFGYFGNDSAVTITNSVNEWNSATAYGGFIVVDTDAVLDMINVNSSYNNAKAGGVIYGIKHNDIALQECNFIENIAHGWGGSINLYDGEIQCDRCHSESNIAGEGGFIYLDESSAYIADSTSLNDIAKYNDTGRGGVVFTTGNVDSPTYVTAINYHIRFATSDLQGAFLFSDKETEILLDNITIETSTSIESTIYFNQGNLLIDRSNFVDNIALNYAGVLFIGNDTKVIINRSEFLNNRANNSGGSIYAIYNTQLSIFESNFTFNHAQFGGAIAIRTGDGNEEKIYENYIDISDTTFEYNEAEISGGSVWIFRQGSDETAELYKHNITFVNNTWINNGAPQGGAMSIDFSFISMALLLKGCYSEVSELSTVFVYGNTFIDNYASKYGGAFLFGCLNVNIEKSDFNSCHSNKTGTGGVGYVIDSDVVINECDFTSEEIVESDGQLFYISNLEDDVYNRFMVYNSSIYGFQKQGSFAYSLITVKAAASIEFDTVNFHDNNVSLFYAQGFYCSLVSFYRCDFLSNYGYTIIDMDHYTVQNNMPMTHFKDVTFANNEIVFNLVRLQGSYANFNNLIVENNTNSQLYSTFIQVSNMLMSNSLFMSNTGKYEGILSVDFFSKGSIIDTQFYNNHVDVIGGAIRSYADSLTINNCSFHNNSASLKGGHIAQYEGELYIVNCSFEYGYTQGNGGAIWRGAYQMTSEMITQINSTVFAYNYASFHGGAILHGTMTRNKATYLNLNDVQFIENTAEHSGAAIYIKNQCKNIQLNIFGNNVKYINNTAYDLNYDIMTWPNTLNISSNISSFCPKECNGFVSTITYDLFNREWPPHIFHEYLFVNPNNNMTYTSVKQFAKLFKHSIELKQKVEPNNKSVNNPQLDIIEQSEYFTQGRGSEIFQYYPAIYDDNISLIIQGYLSDGTTMFDNKSIQLRINECEAHMGAYTKHSMTGFTCYMCPSGEYRFGGTTHTDECLSCQPGSRCYGGRNVTVENDHYPYRSSVHSELIVMECLPGACCQEKECDVWNTMDNYQCPEGRDPSSPMCASCRTGLSAVLQTNRCMECETQLWYFVFPFVMYGGLIWWWGRTDTFDASLSFLEVYVFKILGFFYQVTPSINILLPDNSATTDTLDYLSIVERFFNFQLPLTTHALCVLEDMTNLQKILLSLSVPIMCVIWLIIFYILNKYGCCNFLKNKCCTKGIAMKIFNFYFIKALIKFCIYVYATITRISFALLTCRSFDGGHSKMYYAAEIECLQAWHILPIVGAIITILCPILLFLRLYCIRKVQEKDNALWHLLTLGYKRRTWWYESYRMFCRLLIILFSAIKITEVYRLVLIRYICFGFLIIHTWVLPFKVIYKHDLIFDINKIDVICLMLLCVLTMLADYDHKNTRTVYTILKYIPAFMGPILFVYKVVIHSDWICMCIKERIPPKEQLIPQNTTNIFHSILPDAQQVQLAKNRYSESDSELQNINVVNKQRKSNEYNWDKSINDNELIDSDDELNDNNNNKLLIPPPTPTSPLILKLKNENESNDSDNNGVGIAMKINKNKTQSIISKGGAIYSSISVHDDDIDTDDR